MPGVLPPAIQNHYFTFCRLHGYKILAAFVILFVAMQFMANFVSYRHRFSQSFASGPNFIAIASNDRFRESKTSHHLPSFSVPTDNAENSNLQHLSKNGEMDRRSALSRNDSQLDRMKNSSLTTPSRNSSASPRTLPNGTAPSQTKRPCPVIPPKLVGRLKVLLDSPPFETMEEMFPELEPGGRFRPHSCEARHKVAIIIPYRDREEHLRIFLHNIHPMLQRQQLDYGIYIVEEIEKTSFNRAKLMNIGFKEALKQYDYQCFIFHDVDLIPEDDRNIYSCPERPRHMSVAIDEMNYKLPYASLFGGVSALTKDQMVKVNGFSNEFWGWGGEDDDMYNRISFHGFQISRYSAEVARYKMLKHKKDTPNPDRYKKLYKGRQRFKTDGLTNLKYNRMDIIFKKLYTWVLVDVLAPQAAH